MKSVRVLGFREEHGRLSIGYALSNVMSRVGVTVLDDFGHHPTAIAETRAVGMLSGIPTKPITPKLTNTAATEGTRINNPARTERKMNAEIKNTLPRIWRIFSTLHRIISSFSARLEAMPPPIRTRTLAGNTLSA